MGNCLGSLFGTLRRKSKKNYFAGRYKEYNVGIEFESLIEDDLAQQAQLAAVTEREKDHLLNKRYSELIQDQNRRDAEIDAELKKQEESIRLEEEAYIAAKKESARAAHQARLLEQQRTKPIANGTAKSSWLGDNENEWNVAGGDDDFEMFLESVKARSQSVRANGIALNPYNSSHLNQPVLASSNATGNSGGSLSTQEASSEQLESDSDFEPNFVAAESTQETSLTTNGTLGQDCLKAGKSESTVDTTSSQLPKQNGMADWTQVETPAEDVLNHSSDSMNIHVTQVAPALPEKPVISDSIAMTTAAETKKAGSISPAVTNGTKTTEAVLSVSEKNSVTEAAVLEEDPFDFDKFLEELDLE